MTFNEAKKLLDGGFPIKHEKFGTLYSHINEKNSVWPSIGGKNCKKVTITNMDDFYVIQPVNYVEIYKLISSITQYKDTDNWEVVT